jgi:hypothetical protein
MEVSPHISRVRSLTKLYVQVCPQTSRALVKVRQGCRPFDPIEAPCRDPLVMFLLRSQLFDAHALLQCLHHICMTP